MTDVCAIDERVSLVETVKTEVGSANDEMDEYRKYVRAVAARADGIEVIQNRTPAHAGILLSALFDAASHEVNIICGALDDTAYGVYETVQSAINYLRCRNGEISIVLEEKLPYAKSKFFRALRDAGLMNRVHVRVASPELVKTYVFHFLLADRKHYRFQLHRKDFAAIAQFGVSDTARLKTAFDAINERSTEYTPS